uniref:EF-hand domain-containing protein n=1 Tax=Pyramimonas obovata TaxID=1411642 RepID=A0A7S0WLJ1_9CHLO|mmetsp:Transcript_29831/g.65194  ORF Transcript_29831/g.65194 Transcript_29831/m.65194 type:complete len:817 (+) Transcript_29831:103-2553(+)|eukprot:CAMPEP_0118920846 /NCGR_PEP_ID=MMETSP1169-20130426/275_1 /TAXON_ID=36882 /ORGANISM="Pyramimonas obovata, Strain CCMP722" /LENGTH=816 /DNA_ID=CAMNT_0006861453 /DNA_START=68 /DNA_END=2518 /DNA_ORIENTATION=-
MSKAAGAERTEKVKAIFATFDKNDDGRLSKEEMATFVVAVNPTSMFTEEQISAILDEVFRTYGAYIDGGGLSLDGLRRTYDDGAGDVDRDFDALGLTLASHPDPVEPDPTPPTPEPVEQGEIMPESPVPEAQPSPAKPSPSKAGSSGKQPAVAPAEAPKELSPAVKELLADLEQTLKENGHDNSPEGQAHMSRVLAEIRHRADTLPSRNVSEYFDAHMEMGAMLGTYHRWEEALRSYRRAVALRPDDAKAHFRIGNSNVQLDNLADARESYDKALKAGRGPGDKKLLPQIYVNLGVALETDGFLMRACDQYRQAAILQPTHFRALKLLGSALFALGELEDAEQALTHAVALRPDYASALCDLGNAKAGQGKTEEAVSCYERALKVDGDLVEALYNMGNAMRSDSKYESAIAYYDRTLAAIARGAAPPDWPVWKVYLNRMVSMLGKGAGEKAVMAELDQVYKMTGKRVELYELKKMLRNSGKKKAAPNKGLLTRMKSLGTSSTNGQPPQARTTEEGAVQSANTFARKQESVSTPKQMRWALELRAVQNLLILGTCSVEALKREATDRNLDPNDRSMRGKVVRKATVERVFRELTQLKAEEFAAAMRSLNLRVLAVLDSEGQGTVDLGRVLAVLAVLCEGSPEERAAAAYEILLWQGGHGGGQGVPPPALTAFFRDLYAVFKPKAEPSEPPAEVRSGGPVSQMEFQMLFANNFPYMAALEKLEAADRVRHNGRKCDATLYPIVGPRYYCKAGEFNLSSSSYALQLVPADAPKLSVYIFDEILFETTANKTSRFACYSPHSEVARNHSSGNLQALDASA